MDTLPTVRIEIEGMRHAIVTKLSEHHQEIEDEVNRHLENAVANLDLGRIVRRTVEAEITAGVVRSIEGFFRYGPGRKLVDDAVTKVLPGPAED